MNFHLKMVIFCGGVEYVDYKNIDELLRFNVFEDGGVFVLADDLDVPVFKTNINLIADNIYDVLALSPKLFIFNADVVMQSLFPGEAIRLSKTKKGADSEESPQNIHED